MKGKSHERVSAEGIIIALERLALMAAEQEAKEANMSMTSGSMSIQNGEFKITGLSSLVFSIVHPWIEIHTDDGGCGNSDAEHEREYEQMVDQVRAILRNR